MDFFNSALDSAKRNAQKVVDEGKLLLEEVEQAGWEEAEEDAAAALDQAKRQNDGVADGDNDDDGWGDADGWGDDDIEENDLDDGTHQGTGVREDGASERRVDESEALTGENASDNATAAAKNLFGGFVNNISNLVEKLDAIGDDQINDDTEDDHDNAGNHDGNAQVSKSTTDEKVPADYTASSREDGHFAEHSLPEEQEPERQDGDLLNFMSSNLNNLNSMIAKNFEEQEGSEQGDDREAESAQHSDKPRSVLGGLVGQVGQLGKGLIGSDEHREHLEEIDSLKNMVADLEEQMQLMSEEKALLSEKIRDDDNNHNDSKSDQASAVEDQLRARVALLEEQLAQDTVADADPVTGKQGRKKTGPASKKQAALEAELQSAQEQADAAQAVRDQATQREEKSAARAKELEEQLETATHEATDATARCAKALANLEAERQRNAVHEKELLDQLGARESETEATIQEVEQRLGAIIEGFKAECDQLKQAREQANGREVDLISQLDHFKQASEQAAVREKELAAELAAREMAAGAQEAQEKLEATVLKLEEELAQAGKEAAAREKHLMEKLTKQEKVAATAAVEFQKQLKTNSEQLEEERSNVKRASEEASAREKELLEQVAALDTTEEQYEVRITKIKSEHKKALARITGERDALEEENATVRARAEQLAQELDQVEAVSTAKATSPGGEGAHESDASPDNSNEMFWQERADSGDQSFVSSNDEESTFSEGRATPSPTPMQSMLENMHEADAPSKNDLIKANSRIVELEAFLKENETKASDFQAEIEKMAQALSASEEEVKRLTAGQAESSQLRAEAERLTQALSASEEEVKRLTAGQVESSQLRAEAERLSQALSASEEEVKRLTAGQAEASELQAKAERLAQALSASEEEAKRLADFQEKASESQAEVERLAQALHTSECESKRLSESAAMNANQASDQLAAARKEVEELRTKMADQENLIAEQARKQAEELRTKLADQEKLIAEHVAAKQVAEKQAEGLSDSLSQAVEKHAAWQSQLSAVLAKSEPDPAQGQVAVAPVAQEPTFAGPGVPQKGVPQKAGNNNRKKNKRNRNKKNKRQQSASSVDASGGDVHSPLPPPSPVESPIIGPEELLERVERLVCQHASRNEANAVPTGQQQSGDSTASSSCLPASARGDESEGKKATADLEKDLLQAKAEVEAELEDIRSEKEKIAAEYNEALRAKEDESRAQTDRLEALLAEKEATAMKLGEGAKAAATRAEELEEKIRVSAAESQTALATAESEKSVLEASLSAVQKQFDDLLAQVERQAEEEGTSKVDLSATKQRIEELEKRLEESVAALEVKDEKVSQLEEAAQSACSRIAELEKSVVQEREAAQDVKQLEAKVAELEQALQQSGDVEGKLSSTQSKLEQALAEHDELRAGNARLKAHVAELRASAESAKGEFESEREAFYAEMNVETAKLNATISELNSKNTSLSLGREEAERRLEEAASHEQELVGRHLGELREVQAAAEQKVSAANAGKKALEQQLAKAVEKERSLRESAKAETAARESEWEARLLAVQQDMKTQKDTEVARIAQEASEMAASQADAVAVKSDQGYLKYKRKAQAAQKLAQQKINSLNEQLVELTRQNAELREKLIATEQVQEQQRQEQQPRPVRVDDPTASSTHASNSNQRASAAAAQLMEVKERAFELESRVASLEADKRALEDSVQALTVDKEQHEARLATVQADIDSRERQHIYQVEELQRALKRKDQENLAAQQQLARATSGEENLDTRPLDSAHVDNSPEPGSTSEEFVMEMADLSTPLKHKSSPRPSTPAERQRKSSAVLDQSPLQHGAGSDNSSGTPLRQSAKLRRGANTSASLLVNWKRPKTLALLIYIAVIHVTLFSTFWSCGLPSSSTLGALDSPVALGGAPGPAGAPLASVQASRD